MTQHAYQLIVFDFDGTLVDSQRTVVEAAETAFQKLGLARPAAQDVRRTVGLRLDDAMRRLLPPQAEGRLVEQVVRYFREAFYHLRSEPDFEEPLFPGVRETLASLDVPEVCLGIATGKSRRGLLDSLQRHDLGGNFVTLQTADSGRGKPHPELLLQAMAEAGVGPRDTVMVGDTTFDMEMACNAGADALGVCWGYHENAELEAAGALSVLESFSQLPAALFNLTEART